MPWQCNKCDKTFRQILQVVPRLYDKCGTTFRHTSIQIRLLLGLKLKNQKWHSDMSFKTFGPIDYACELNKLLDLISK